MNQRDGSVGTDLQYADAGARLLGSLVRPQAQQGIMLRRHAAVAALRLRLWDDRRTVVSIKHGHGGDDGSQQAPDTLLWILAEATAKSQREFAWVECAANETCDTHMSYAYRQGGKGSASRKPSVAVAPRCVRTWPWRAPRRRRS